MFAFTSWFRFIFPIFIAITTSFLLINSQEAIPLHTDSLATLPYIFYIIVLILAIMFKRSRLAMLALANLVTYATIQLRLQSPLATGTTFLEYCLLVFLYPVGLYLIYLFKNTAVITKYTLYYIGIIALLICWSAVSIEYYQELKLSEIYNSLLFVHPSVSKLPIFLVLYLFALLGISAVIQLNYNKQMNTAIFSSMTFFAVTVVLFDVSFISSAMFSIDAILQIVYLVFYIRAVAYRDKLTGLASRRALESELPYLKKRYSVAMLDVDHFKKFNDSHGHDAGDDVLRLVGSKLQSVCKKAQVFRYGGEEFTVIYKGTRAEEAKQNLEALREAIADYDMTIRNSEHRPKNNKLGALKRNRNDAEYQTVNVTISIGVCDSSASSLSPEEILKSADEALYEAKKKGRNRVEISQQIN